MHKYKICVYAISKNEEQFVDRWFESMKEADYIVVLDTGSTDNTVQKLKAHNVIVQTKIISPWRFDEARNESLKLVPPDTDICVCTDLDEVFEKGWREKIEKIWKPDTTQLKYTYVWNQLENGSDGITFLYEKIHANNKFKWLYPVHEILVPTFTENNLVLTAKELILRHFPDPKKSRSQYLNLLEQSVIEYPESDRNTHYLGREYMYQGKYRLAIKTLSTHLKMRNSTWSEERSASFRYIGDCYCLLSKKINETKKSFIKKFKNVNLRHLVSKNNSLNNSLLKTKNNTFNNNFLKNKLNIKPLKTKNKFFNYKINYYLSKAEFFYKKSIQECLETREGYLSLAKFYYYEKRDYISCINTLNSMLQIQTKTLSYITSPYSWNEYPYDLLSMCYYYLKYYKLAFLNANIALSINPNDLRIKNNADFFKGQINR